MQVHNKLKGDLSGLYLIDEFERSQCSFFHWLQCNFLSDSV